MQRKTTKNKMIMMMMMKYKYIERYRLIQMIFWFVAIILGYIVFENWRSLFWNSSHLKNGNGSYLRNGRYLRHPIIGVVMMVHNDDDILPYWLQYHTSLFGTENIIILDNQSSEKTLRLLFDWNQKNHLQILWNQIPYSQKGNLTYHTFKDYLSHIDIAIPLDSDEFLVAFSQGANPIYQKSQIYEELIQFWEMEISCWGLQQYYTSVHPSINDTIQTIQSFHPAIYTLETSKKMIRMDRLQGLDHGSHSPLLGNGQCVSALNHLGLLHYHFRSPHITAQRALNDVIGFEYLPSNVTLETVSPYRSKLLDLSTQSVNGIHKIKQLLTYIDKGIAGLVHNIPDDEVFVLPTIDQIVRTMQHSN